MRTSHRYPYDDHPTAHLMVSMFTGCSAKRARELNEGRDRKELVRRQTSRCGNAKARRDVFHIEHIIDGTLRAASMTDRHPAISVIQAQASHKLPWRCCTCERSRVALINNKGIPSPNQLNQSAMPPCRLPVLFPPTVLPTRFISRDSWGQPGLSSQTLGLYKQSSSREEGA